MKKLFAALLAVLMVLSLAACTGTPKIDSSKKTTGATTAAETEPATEPATEATEAEETSAPDTETEPAAALDFEELVIVDDENCTFKVTGIDPNGYWGYTIKVFLENKTDKELMFSWDNVSLNGFMCDPFWACSVTAGMKANEEISFYEEDLELNGIQTVTDISFDLTVYDSNDWSADYLVSDNFTIYPYGEEAVTPYVREAVEGETVLVDNEYCTIIIVGYDPDNYWGYTVNVYLENKTDSTLMFAIEDAAVNGFMCDPFWADTVAGGKRSNTEISWSSSDFEANGIAEVETLVLPFSVYNYDDWSADYYVDETFTVNP